MAGSMSIGWSLSRRERSQPFISGGVRLCDYDFVNSVTYPLDWERSALATIDELVANRRLARFQNWFGGFQCFRMDPFAMGARARNGRLQPIREPLQCRGMVSIP